MSDFVSRAFIGCSLSAIVLAALGMATGRAGFFAAACISVLAWMLLLNVALFLQAMDDRGR